VSLHTKQRRSHQATDLSHERILPVMGAAESGARLKSLLVNGESFLIPESVASPVE
jgi:hypothetical protein